MLCELSRNLCYVKWTYPIKFKEVRMLTFTIINEIDQFPVIILIAQ